MLTEKNDLICYKQIEINQEKLAFFSEKHSTKEGTWGELSLENGEIDFVFLNSLGQELSRTRLNHDNCKLIIPPASWHKIVPMSTTFSAELKFYCKIHRYFKKKYNINSVHQDLLYVYQTYLKKLGPLTTLDVGCGSGRNLLYLAKLGYPITGIDISQPALENILLLAEKEKMSHINVVAGNLNELLRLEQNYYDFVFSTVTLQFLNASRILSLLNELQEATKKQGYHFFVFPVQSERYLLPKSFTYLPKKEELYHFYQDKGWSILEYRETVGHLHKQDKLGRPIPGLFCLLLAQKIN
ncbi:SAM-dependent methyltransferase TehB (plasmid) [Legionella sp. D16C41]|uniref:SAM-dependent methyltransferase TehB n=1 Tax=Legionella sp. D16C41 TaxID=3402688 RepID=UPI003AF7FFB2